MKAAELGKVVAEFLRKNWYWLQPIFLPRFNTKITSIVVVAGLGIVATPLWEPIVVEVIRSIAGIEVSLPGESWHGLVLVGVGLVYNVVSQLLDSANRNIEAKASSEKLEVQRLHDCEIAKRIRIELPQEAKDNLIYRLWNEDACLQSDCGFLDRIRDCLLSVETVFIDSEVKIASERLLEVTLKLNSFIAYKFFVYPERQSLEMDKQFALQPNWNVDRGGSGSPEDDCKYFSLQAELNNLTKEFERTFNNLFSLFHTRLLCV